MLHVQRLGKRRAYEISESGENTERGVGSVSEVPSEALHAVKSIRTCSSASGRAFAAVNAKRAVTEMHCFMDVISMLRSRDALSLQRCSRPLSNLPVGTLAPCSLEASSTLKYQSFSGAEKILDRALSDARKSIKERRSYATGCVALCHHWSLLLQHAAPGLQTLRFQDLDSVNVDCSFSRGDGKYAGDDWSQTLSIGTDGPELQNNVSTQMYFTLAISLQSSSGLIGTCETLWDLIGNKTRLFDEEIIDYLLREKLQNLDLTFQKKAHDSLCRELFDQLQHEVLQISERGLLISENKLLSESGIKKTDSFFEGLLKEEMTSALLILQVTRMKISLRISSGSILNLQLVPIRNYDFSANPDPTSATEECNNCSDSNSVENMILCSSKDDKLRNALKSSISACLLVPVIKTIRQWKSIIDVGSIKKENVIGMAKSR